MQCFDDKMIQNAKAAKSATELLEFAKANGVKLTKEEASAYFKQLNPKCGELDDDELDNVAGGACSQDIEVPTCPMCGSTLTSVWYADPDLNSYKLCYGCGNYGLWYSGDGTRVLPELRAKYLVEKTSGNDERWD